MSTFVLTLPNYAILFVVKIDASDSGIDAVLLQSGHPAAFISKTDIALPLAKLSLDLLKQVEGPSSPERRKRTYVVLVSTGSFNPPTYMHLRCFELARDALTSEGFCVIGGYMLPVNDAYKKKSLISAEHRVAMCQLACKSSELVMTDPWEKNIQVVDEVVPNGISSTRLRDCISKGLSVKYLTADEVIDYIKQHNLYKEQLSNN
ncbi:nicotinamide/nicotinic acid mononucleotide adenylyltransferase isoform X2 [Capsicum annuum]